MSFRTWLYVFAITGLTLASSGQVWSQSAAEDQPSQEDGAPYTSTKGDDQDETTVDLAPALKGIESAIRDLIAEEDKVAAEAQQSRENRDLDAQESMAKWAELMFYATAATVALTLAALFAIVRTLHHTRRAADSSERMASDTQKIGPAQVRAYVSVEQATGALHEPTRVFGVTFRIRNNGQSPATNCKIGFDLTVYDAGRIVHSQTEGSKCPIQSISANSSVESLPIGNRDWDLDGLIADAGGALSLQIQGAFEGEDVFGGEIREDFTFYGFAEKEISISEIVFVRIQGAEKAS